MLAASLAALVLALGTGTAGPSTAQDAVKAYLAALHAQDMRAAFARLTPSQRKYFISIGNFASNFESTAYALERYKLGTTIPHGNGTYEIDVRETFQVRDAATGARLRVTTDEPYFAIEEDGAMGVKQIGQPWRAYALDARGEAQGLLVRVVRVEYFDRRVQLDCVFYNRGRVPITILPLLKSTLSIDGARPVAAFSDARFPLNDKALFKGPIIAPGTGVSGYISFPLAAKVDAAQRLGLVVAPALAQSAEAPFSVSVGPFDLPKR